jgi:hypothetical protein
MVWNLFMKSFILSLALLIAGYISSFADFPNVWFKKLPDVTVIGNVRFSHDSKKLLYTGGNIYNQILDVETGDVLIDSIPLSLNNSFFSLDDKYLIGVNGKKVIKYNLQTRIDESQCEESQFDILQFNISKDQKYLIGTTSIGYVIWDLVSNNIFINKDIQFDSKASSKQIGDMIITNDNSNLILSIRHQYTSYDNQGKPTYKYSQDVNEYDFNTQQLRRTFFSRDTNSTGANLKWVTLSNNNQTVAIVTGAIRLYKYNSLEQISSINYTSLNETKFTPDDKYIVTVSGTGGDNLSLWEVNTGVLINKETETSFETLDISNNSQFICISVANYLILKKFQTTGVSTTLSEFQILYPNPSNGFVNILVLSQNAEQFSIQIKDLLGSSVMTIPSIVPENNIINLNISHISKGTYFLNLNSNNSTVIYKLIKE